jgi:hypothetical protein
MSSMTREVNRMQRLKDAANPSSRPYSLTPVLIKGAARRGNDRVL